jgi:hypothetical protein
MKKSEACRIICGKNEDCVSQKRILVINQKYVGMKRHDLNVKSKLAHDCTEKINQNDRPHHNGFGLQNFY